MWDFNLLAATRSIESFMPFMLYRLMIYMGVSIGYLLAALIGAGTLIAFASFSANPLAAGNLGAFLGFSAFGFLVYKFRGLLFFSAKAGHLALIGGEALEIQRPENKSLLDYARQAALDHFKTASLFYQMSAAIKRTLRDLPEKCGQMPECIKHEAGQTLWVYLNRCVMAPSDQSILALQSFERHENPWKSVKKGLILQAAHYPQLFKNRLFLWCFENLLLLVLFILIYQAITGAVITLPASIGLWAYVAALTLAWGLKATFFEPIATAAMAKLYFKFAEAGVDDSKRVELEGFSESFKEIEQKA